MESRKGSRIHSLKIKQEQIDDEYETPRLGKLPTNTHHRRQEMSELSDTPSLMQKLHAVPNVKQEYNESADYSHENNDYYKSHKNKKDFKCNWSSEEDELLTKLCKDQTKKKNWKRVAEYFEGKTDIQCMQRWEKYLNPENNKGKKRPWTEEEDILVIKLVEKHGPQKWTFIADHLPGRIGKQCRERWHNHLNPIIKKSSWALEEEWLLFLHHKAIGNKWADIAKFLPGRTDNSIKNHWNSSMKKRLPELLNRFQKLKEAGGLTYVEKMSDISKAEKELLETLFRMGDKDYHSIHGIITESGRSDEKENHGNADKKITVELKAFNSLAKLPGDSSSRKKGVQDSYDQTKSPQDSATIRKLVEEIQFNPKTCDEIHKYIKEHNLDIPPIETLDLKNPSNLKLLEQLYNMKSLKPLLKHNHSLQRESKKQFDEEEDSKIHRRNRDPNSGSRRDQCSSCKRRNSHHHHSYRHSSKSHRGSDNYQKGFNQQRPEPHMYYGAENHGLSNSKNDTRNKFISRQQDFESSPILPKEPSHQLPSSNYQLSIKKEEVYPNFYHGGKKEDDLFGSSSFYNSNPDSYLFGSPLPFKKVKAEESARNSLGLLDFAKQNESDLRDRKRTDKSMDIIGVNHENDENQDPNLAHNMVISTRNKAAPPLFLNSSASKDNSHAGGFLFSPKPTKYESPSRLINFCTPDYHHQTQNGLASGKKFYNGDQSAKSPNIFSSKGFVPYDKTASFLKF